MILTLKPSVFRHYIQIFTILVAAGFGVLPFVAAAQEGVSITVAPTLIELSVTPGEVWQSSVKVVNTNQFPLRIYATSAHFEPTGERGSGNIVPRSDIPNSETVLANWITIPDDAVTIPPNTSQQVAFVLQVPEDAAPGSHFGAIQVSTVSSEQQAEAGLATAQVISSLLFLRVEGDVQESATLRSFTATDSFGVEPQTSLELRFENRGNVHVRPVGEITIHNMWGSERGRIPVNVNTSFGNALPGTIRTYDFSWRRDASLLEIGRYTADVTLAYGTDAKQFASAETAFWVIPVKPLLTAILVIVGIITIIGLVSRWYIKWLLAQAGVASIQTLQATKKPKHRTSATGHELNLTEAATAPKHKGLLQRFNEYSAIVIASGRNFATLWQATSTKARWFGVGGAGLIVLLLAVFIWSQSGQNNHAYEATIGLNSQAVTYNSEEITFFQQPGRTPELLNQPADYEVALINASQSPGAAGELADTLIDDFPVSSLESTAERRGRTVILFPEPLQTQAVALSEVIPGALLSTVSEATTTITIYIGDN